MLVSLNGVNKKYIDKVILNDVSFAIEEQDKIGIIGVNGTGKSTLLNIIMGINEEDSGKIYYKKDLKISYMQQFPNYNLDETILNTILNEDKEILEYDAKAMLNKMGLSDYNQICRNLSGGELRRLSLAITLLKPADLLMLDEPTNHLDIWMINWLEDFLIKYNRALILVTHDRYFLERVTKKILEIELGKVYQYDGNYSFYLEAKAERINFLVNNERRMESILRREKQWVEMNAQARSTKSKERLERYKLMTNELDQLTRELNANNEITLGSIKSRMGKKTIIIENLTKTINNKLLFYNVNYIVSKTDRLGIVGPNGCGKTTLFNTILGYTAPDSGRVAIGETIKVGYFHQNMIIPDESITVIQYVKQFGEYLEVGSPKGNIKIAASELLENYLFTPTIQYMPISKLSGGEKRRLQLLGVLISNPNVLFLDEPTNDFDIDTLIKLEAYLESFQGAVIVISHDRYFLDKVIKHLFYFDEGRVLEYISSVSDFIDSYTPNKKANKEKIENKKEVEIPRFTSKEKKEFDNIENEIEELEAKIKAVEKEMLAVSSDYLQLLELQAKKDELNEKLMDKLSRWEYLSDINEKIIDYKRGKLKNE